MKKEGVVEERGRERDGERRQRKIKREEEKTEARKKWMGMMMRRDNPLCLLCLL